MIRYDDDHVSVRISSAGLRQAYGRSEYLRVEDAKRVNKLLAGVAVFAVLVVGGMSGFASVFGN